MNSRMKEMYAYMETQNLDVALVTLPAHIYYLTGFLSNPHERFLGLILPKGEEPFLLVPALDLEAAREASCVKRIFTHTDTQNPYDILKSHLSCSIKRFGIEKSDVTMTRYEALMASVAADVYVDVEEPLRNMRVRKSADEITRMKRAIFIIEEALRQTLPKVKPGVTELDLVAELEYQMKKLGADAPSFSTLILAGENSALPHGAPGSRQVQQHEFLLFDCGVFADGYASDITRTFAVGEMSDKQVEIYNTVLAANLAAIEATRPGVELRAIDGAARHVITEKGYGEYFVHRVGHGLGMDVHEYPSVHGENKDLTVEGMVITIEPGIYLPGVGGVRIEDDVVVTRNGAEVLTTFPKQLMMIGS